MEKIAEKDAENELKRLITSAWQAKSDNQKEEAKQKLIRFVKEENRFNQQAYQNNKNEVEKSLARLRGEAIENQEQKLNNNAKILLIIGALALAISFSLIFLVKIRNRRRLKQ
ncbi:MAG: hypothetical protein NY202_05600 [Mollicutes bacterium UO1]